MPKTKFKVGKLSSDVRGFFGVGDVKLSLDAIDLVQWSQKNSFPITCDWFGNYIVIGLSNDDVGKIYLCDHENGNKAEYLADSLKEFFAVCKSEK